MIPTNSVLENDPGTASNTIGSSRLQKAIERNRRKVAARENLRKKEETRASVLIQEEDQGQVQEEVPASEEAMASMEDQSLPHSPQGPFWVDPYNSTEVVQESAPLLPRSSPKPLSTSSPFAHSLKKGLNSLYKILGWCVCLGLLFRLIFSQGGVVDFLSMEKILEGRLQHLNSLQSENNQLINEIIKIQTDQTYQKQLVRDHLGVIAPDEFLILFATEKAPRSI